MIPGLKKPIAGRRALAAFALAAMLAAGAYLSWRQRAALPGEVRIGDDVTVRVAVADTEATRERGLSGHAPLAPDEGMWFVFARADRYAFWMPRMLFDLDIIWVRDGRVVDISPDVPAPEPGQTDLPLYRPVEPADRVLEVRAGFAREHGLKLGLPVTFRYK
jgi:uncharacterized membrane protein (UPF0127 family)